MQVQLGAAAYQALRRRAYERGCSISAVVRELIDRGLAVSDPKRPRGIRQFSFVGSAASMQGKLAPVSERHDEALAEVIVDRKRRR